MNLLIPSADDLCPLDTVCVFHLYQSVSPEVKEALYDVPGVKVWKHTTVRAPVHIADKVGTALTGAGFPFRFTIERGKGVDAEGAEAAVLASELREGMWEGWYRPFQREGVLWAVQRGSGHLWHAPGAGKTASAIAWALARPGNVVAVTKAGIRPHWGREVQKVSNIVPWVSDPSARQRKGWDSPHAYLARCRQEGRRPFFIVGWEELSGLVFAEASGEGTGGFLRGLKFTSLVMDEIHNAKSRKRKRWTVGEGHQQWKSECLENRVAAAEYLAGNASRRLATTGTPIPDRVRDLWGQLDLIEPKQWGGYWRWATRYCNGRPGQYGGIEDKGTSRVEELRARLEYVRHRVPYEVSHGQLPEKRREVMFVGRGQLSTPTAGARKEVKTAPDRETRLEAMLRLACSRKRREIIDQTVDAVKGGSKVVIFTGRRADCAALHKGLEKKLPGHRVWVAHGGFSGSERDEIRGEYMEEQSGCVLVATGESMGEGVDLQDTDLALIAMLPWTPRAVEQWEQRFHRQGQTRPVIVRYLIAENTVDEHVCEILLGKLPAVADLAESAAMGSAAHDLKGLGNRDEILGKLADRLKMKRDEEDAA